MELVRRRRFGVVQVTNKPQMKADARRYKHEETTQKAMTIALRYEGLQVEKEFPLVARFRGQLIGDFKADLVVRGSEVACFLQSSQKR